MNSETSPRHVILVHPGEDSWRQGAVLRRLAARVAAWQAEPNRPPLTVILHSPWGEVSATDVPASAELHNTLDLISPARRQAVHEWVHRLAADLCSDSSGLFPTHSGIPFGMLNRLQIHQSLWVFRVLEESLLEVSRRVPIRSVEILTLERRLSDGLADTVHGSGFDVMPWGPPDPGVLRAGRDFLLGMASRARELVMPTRPNRDPVIRSGVDVRGGALIVSWTAPMIGMFEPVENAMDRAGIRWARLQFDSDRAPLVESRGNGHILHLGPPGAGPPMGFSRLPGQSSARLSNGGVPGTEFEDWSPRSEEALVSILDIGGLYRKFFDPQANHIADVEAIVEQLDPGIVIVGNDRWWVGQTFTHVARRRAVPSICLQDGVAEDNSMYRWMSASVTALTSRHLGDILQAGGISGDRLTVTGQPRYDHLAQVRGPDAVAEARKLLNLTDDRIHVLFATQYTQGFEYVKMVVDAILACDEVHLLLRPHPSGDAELHRRIADEYDPIRVSVRRNDDIADLLMACDVLVAQTSTVILEAAILEKPVISAQFDGMVNVDHVEGTGAVMARTPEDVTNALRESMARWREGEPARPAGQEEREYFLGPVDGRSADRVVELVKRLLATRVP